MKVPIYSMKGKASKSSATLPSAFEEPVRLDLIRRAVRAARANSVVKPEITMVSQESQQGV